MQRGADSGGGVHLVDKGRQVGEEIVPGEFRGPQVLDAGVDDVNRHGHHLGDDDVFLQIFEVLNVIQEKIPQGDDDQHIPEAIGDEEELVEGNQIVQSAVHHMAGVVGDEVLRQKIEEKIHQPSGQQLEVGKLRVDQLGKAELPVINNRLFHRIASVE